MGGDHADQAAGPVGERRRLDRAEGGGGRDVAVRRKQCIDVDIDDDRLGPSPGGPSARRPVVIDYREVFEKLRAETALGGDPQRTGRGIENLDIAAVRAGQRKRPLQDLADEQTGPWDLAQGPSRRVQSPGRSRLIQIQADPRSELLGAPGLIVPAERPEPGRRPALNGFRFFKQPSEFPVLSRPHKQWKRLDPPGVIPESTHGLILQLKLGQARDAEGSANPA